MYKYEVPRSNLDLRMTSPSFVIYAEFKQKSREQHAMKCSYSPLPLRRPGFSHLSGKLSTKLLAHTPTEGPYIALALKLLPFVHVYPFF